MSQTKESLSELEGTTLYYVDMDTLEQDIQENIPLKVDRYYGEFTYERWLWDATFSPEWFTTEAAAIAKVKENMLAERADAMRKIHALDQCLILEMNCREGVPHGSR